MALTTRSRTPCTVAGSRQSQGAWHLCLEIEPDAMSELAFRRRNRKRQVPGTLVVTTLTGACVRRDRPSLTLRQDRL